MKVLLDECVPRKLRRELTNHQVLTVTERGWSGIENGELLRLPQNEFDVFLTVDQNLRYQQNLGTFDIAVVLIVSKSNRLRALLPLIPKVRHTLDVIQAGDFVRIV
jgi:hypothetical protein